MRAVIAKASERVGQNGRPMTLQLIDVSRAHFYAPSVREVYVQLPQGDPMHGKPDVCGRLCRTMYGTLDAAEQWAHHYTQVLLAAGFTQGTSNPCHFYHTGRDVWLLVHGDDFFSAGEESSQQWLCKILEDQYDLKCERAGEASHLKTQLRVLGRIVSFKSDGITCEADPQHLDVAAHELGLTSCRGVASPGARDSPVPPNHSRRSGWVYSSPM